MTDSEVLAANQALEGDQRLFTVFEIAKILVSEYESDTMLDGTLTILIEMLEAADAGSLWLYDSSDGKLTARAAQGYDLTALKQIRLSPGQAMAGKVFQDGQARLFSIPEATAAMADLNSEDTVVFRMATGGLQRPLSALCVPLKVSQTKVGVVVLLNLRQSANFTVEDMAFLQRVANLISIAIENARLREDLEAAEALSEANRLKAELISTLAHEMRTPLTSIKGYSTALLMEEVDFGAEARREFLQFIDEECDVLQDLIHDLLESSIIDAGLLRLEPQPVQMQRLVASVAEDMARRAQNHRILLDFPDHFPIIDADPDRIIQVMRNLLDNAVKYSPQAGLIVVRGEVDQGEVKVSVADQGVGIAPEHLHRLFDKFFRIKSGLVRHVVGSGLGLPIARTIVETHGGRIWAESRAGEGTTLYFTLPLEGPSQEFLGQEVSKSE